jgi:hypothetical protein
MEPIRTTLNCATHGIPAPPGSRILRLLVLAELLVEEPRPAPDRKRRRPRPGGPGLADSASRTRQLQTAECFRSMTQDRAQELE